MAAKIQVKNDRINSFGGIIFRQEVFKKKPDRRFVQVPFRWAFHSRRWHLQLYTSRPYDRLRL